MSMTITEIKLKVNDVYNFRYSQEEAKKRFEPYHCFDGTLIVRKLHNGGFHLVDTYWASGDSRTFTMEQALADGELTFLCNLDDVEEISEYDKNYYDDADIIIIHMHAGYRTQRCIKKGTLRSKTKMIESVNQKINDAKSRINSAEYDIRKQTENLAKIEAGDTTIYI